MSCDIFTTDKNKYIKINDQKEIHVYLLLQHLNQYHMKENIFLYLIPLPGKNFHGRGYIKFWQVGNQFYESWEKHAKIWELLKNM